MSCKVRAESMPVLVARPRCPVSAQAALTRAARYRRRHQRGQGAVASGIGRLNGGSPGDQFMSRLQAVSPIELDPEVVVLGAMAVFPVALFAAGRVLLWDYKNRPSVPEAQLEGAERRLPTASGSSTYTWAGSNKPLPSKPASHRAVWAASFVTRSLWLSSAMVRHAVARAAFAPDACSSALLTWCWVAHLLQLQDAEKAVPVSPRERAPVLADLAEATMRATVPLALSEARRLTAKDRA